MTQSESSMEVIEELLENLRILQAQPLIRSEDRENLRIAIEDLESKLQTLRHKKIA